MNLNPNNLSPLAYLVLMCLGAFFGFLALMALLSLFQ